MRDRRVKVLQQRQVIPLLYTMHEEPTARHNSAKKMFQQIHERYYWPKMFEDIRGYVKTCDNCQRRGGLQ